jgi:hypothetical protein
LFYTLQILFCICLSKRKLLEYVNISINWILDFSNENLMIVCDLRSRSEHSKQNTNLHTAQILILLMSLSSAKISLNSGFFLHRDEIEFRFAPLWAVSIKWEIWKIISL